MRALKFAGAAIAAVIVVIALPQMLHHMTPLEVSLLFAGGLLYTVGIPVLVVEKPDPWPATFGYHEIWHVCVIVAVVLHSVMAWRLAGILD